MSDLQKSLDKLCLESDKRNKRIDKLLEDSTLLLNRYMRCNRSFN